MHPRFCVGIQSALVVQACVSRLQPAFSLSFSWVIGYAAHGTRDLQATQWKGNAGMEETEVTEACLTFFPPLFTMFRYSILFFSFINFVLFTFSSNTPRSSRPSLHIFFLNISQITKYPHRAMQVSPPFLLPLLNFPPHPDSYSSLSVHPCLD